MNILFLMKYFEIGGIEVVTSFLSNKFIIEGHKVIIASCLPPEKAMLSRLNENIKFYTLCGYNCNSENIQKLHQILVKHKIDIIINQWGLPFIPLRLIRKACKNLKCKVISVYHSDPQNNARLISVKEKKEKCTSNLLKYFFSIQYQLFKKITCYSMKFNYNHSDQYVILSQSFIKNFKAFTGITNPSKLRAISNPSTISSDSFSYSYNKKKKNIIFVGRLNNNPKRIDRIIDIWKYLENDYPEWNLIIVGDGPDKENIENYTQEKHLKRVYFEGFQAPKKYYEENSILLLTSEYEGFGLVVVEAMQFGVVPVVYGSYDAIYDIITDQKDGFIIPPVKKQFNQGFMIQRVKELIENEGMRKEMASNAIMSSKKFSIDNIYADWNNLFTTLLRNNK